MSHYSLCLLVSLLAFSAVRQFPAFGGSTLLMNEDVHEYVAHECVAHE